MTTERSRSRPLDRIAVRPMGAQRGQIVLLAPGEIAYAFLGSSTPPELLAICAENRWRIEPLRVYVRTARALYWTPYRRLAELTRELTLWNDAVFYPATRARVVNTLKITSLDTSGRTPLLVFVAADGGKEILTVTRRAWPALRERLRLPRRGGGAGRSGGGAGRATRDAQRPVRRKRDRSDGHDDAV
jgi:hypothetical protein